MDPIKLASIESKVQLLRPKAAFPEWEELWRNHCEVLRYIVSLRGALGAIATAPLTDMPVEAKAIVIGLQNMAVRALNGQGI